MMRIHHIPLLLILWVASLPCYADVTEYDIEIVVFEDLSNQYLDKEQWPRLEINQLLEQPEIKTKITATTNKAAKTSPTASSEDISISNRATDMLNTQAKILTRSSRYNVLVHKSWRQTGLDAESAINVYISSNKDAENDQTGSSSIDGDIKVILGRYLHIYTDLIYRRANTANLPVLASSQNGQFKEFSIKSHRRMRSKELHYIDHPLVGILVKVLPVKKPVEKPVEDSMESTPESRTTLSE